MQRLAEDESSEDKDPSDFRRRDEEVKRLEFVCRLYAKQVERVRLFLNAHFAQADSWSEDCVEELPE